MIKRRSITSMIFSLFFIANICFASPELSGLPHPKTTLTADQVMQEVDRRSRGFQDLEAHLIMTITDQKARHFKRELQIRILEDPSADRRDKSAIAFLSPADQRGVALLTHRQPKRADDQWLYLPALKRLKKITNRTRNSPFMGSDYSYEDLAPLNLNEYQYEFAELPENPSNSFYRVIQTPKAEIIKHTGYAKRLLSIDESFRIHQIEYFNAQGKPLKQLNISQFVEFAEDRWRPADMLMKTQLTGTQTRLQWQALKTGVGLKPSQFTTLGIKNPFKLYR